MNKKNAYLTTTAMVCGAAMLQAATIGSEAYDELSLSAEVTGPIGWTTVVKAVDLNGTGGVINGITFEADTYVQNTGGNGYTITVDDTPEGAPLTDSIFFTNTTVNLGNNGVMVGDQITGLLTDTDYAFEFYLSDTHAVRNTTISIDIGGGTATNTSGTLDQADASLHRYSIAFNTGSSTTFDWSTSAGFHAKTAAFALYQIPEPSAFAMLAGCLALSAVLVRRRRA